MKFKRITSILLILFIAFSLVQQPANADDVNAFEPLSLTSTEVVFKQTSTKIDAIDPTAAASYFPGGRGANKLIVYTPNYGIHTGTNEFGTEAIVQGNTVTALSGAD